MRRRHDAEASRLGLMRAADELFQERGYDAATVRDIGDHAGLDPALIARYFGGKEGLYLATLQQEGRPAVPTDPMALVRKVINRSDEQGSDPIPRAMVSPALSDAMREQVREIMGARVIGPLSEELAARGVTEPELRTELLLSILAGVSLAREGGTLPILAATPPAEIVAMLEPMLDALQATLASA